jgi:hypothetical protein
MFIVGLLILVAAVVLAVAYGAMRNKRAFAKQNEIVAGTPSRAPAAWAGAHTPEALLHRRLRDAVDAARAQLAAAGTGFEDVVAAIGRGAQEVDDRLIAAAALPAPHRATAIAEVEPSVVALENAVAGLMSSATTNDQTAVTAAVAEAHDRLEALAEARAEVDQADVAIPSVQPQALPRTQPGTQLGMQSGTQSQAGPAGPNEDS